MGYPWIEHVKSVSKKKKITYKEALKIASKSYKQSKKQTKKKQTKKKQTNDRLQKMEGKAPPNVRIMTRVKYNTNNKNPYRWKAVHTKDLFKNKKSILFSLPGAFTPTCSNSHLPDFEKEYKSLKHAGIDNVYCCSVNDAFVMHNWKKQNKIKNIQFIPDGNGDFTNSMGALVHKNNLGFGDRSWRYAMYIDDGIIKKMFIEPNMSDNHETDPFSVSSVHSVLKYIKQTV